MLRKVVITMIWFGIGLYVLYMINQIMGNVLSEVIDVNNTAQLTRVGVGFGASLAYLAAYAASIVLFVRVFLRG